MNNDQLWQAILGEMELLVSKANFSTWFKNTFILSNEEGKFIIAVPNAFTKSWLERKYQKNIIKALQSITDKSLIEITYKIETKRNSQIFPSINQSDKTVTQNINYSTSGQVNQSGLNPKYTFTSFIVGKSNELAKAACETVAQKPGSTYNPLFIYGDVGLGKTHLMQAIGHKILDKDNTKKIIYASSEKFTNDYIQALREGRGKAQEFKNKYRNVDVLMIDDVQFLAGKESTSEEFFNTFNHLYQLNKQIVLSSDRPPKSIPALEKRLTSRFGCGMIADVSSPDIETRIAILEHKIQERELILESEIINYIAENIQDNIREMEGALNRIVAHHQLYKKELDLKAIKDILDSLGVSVAKSTLTPQKIINTIIKFYDIKLEDILGSSRKKNLTLPRQVAMFLMRKELNSSYPSIGTEFGGRDHTTAIHACEKIKNANQDDKKMRNEIAMIKKLLYE